jgi:1,4-dihydroxy-2-naphthoate phytyltransferase
MGRSDPLCGGIPLAPLGLRPPHGRWLRMGLAAVILCLPFLLLYGFTPVGICFAAEVTSPRTALPSHADSQGPPAPTYSLPSYRHAPAVGDPQLPEWVFSSRPGDEGAHRVFGAAAGIVFVVLFAAAVTLRRPPRQPLATLTAQTTDATGQDTPAAKSAPSAEDLRTVTLASTSGQVDQPRDDEPQDRRKLWKAAIKLPIYSVAVMPAVVSAGWLVANQPDAFRLDQMALFVVGAVLLLIWENLANDAYDADTGVDANKPHSVVSLTGRQDLVLLAANAALVAGGTVMAVVAYRSSFEVLALVLACCAVGYVYQGPPFRFGYKGLGEPLCFLAFGPLATKAALTALGGDVSWDIACQLGSGPALATTLIAFCAHFHQVEDDARFGKRSPVVALGTATAAALIPAFVVASLSLELWPTLTGEWPATCALALAGLPAGVELCRLLREHHADPDRIQGSKFIALRFQALTGIGLTIGFCLPTVMAALSSYVSGPPLV